MFRYSLLVVFLVILITAQNTFVVEAIEQEKEINPTESTKQYLIDVAKRNGFNSDEFWLTAWGESKFNKLAINYTNKELSLGIWQINSKVHKITRACAFDLYCSTTRAIEIWKKSPMAWTCFRELRGYSDKNFCGYKRVEVGDVRMASDIK